MSTCTHLGMWFNISPTSHVKGGKTEWNPIKIRRRSTQSWFCLWAPSCPFCNNRNSIAVDELDFYTDRDWAVRKARRFESPLVIEKRQVVPFLPKLCIHCYNNISLCIASQCSRFGIQIMCMFYKRFCSVSLRNTHALSNCVSFLFPA